MKDFSVGPDTSDAPGDRTLARAVTSRGVALALVSNVVLVAALFVLTDVFGATVATYDDLRVRTGELGDRATVSEARRGGEFVFAGDDPYGQGDDGGTVLAAPNGYWVREHEHTAAAPVELDWFERVTAGANITQLIEQLRDRYTGSRDLFVRLPSVPMTLEVGYVAFGAWNRFHLLENTAAVTLALPEPTILDLRDLTWIQRVEDGQPVNAWEAQVPGGAAIQEVWSSPPVGHGIAATEVFHWGNPVVTSPSDDGTDPAIAALVDNLPGSATAAQARFMRYWSGVEGGVTKIVVYATQDPRNEYEVLEGSPSDLAQMFYFDDVQDVYIGGDAYSLTLLGAHRLELGARGDHSSISIYNGKGDCCTGRTKYLLRLGNTSAGTVDPAVIRANIRDTFEGGIGVSGGIGSHRTDRFDLTLGGTMSNTSHWVSYGVRTLVLDGYKEEDPYLNSSVWNGKTGTAAAADTAYRYADRLNGLESGYNDTEDVNSASRVRGFGVPKGTAGVTTRTADLVWESVGGAVYRAAVPTEVVDVWADGKPTGKKASPSVGTLLADGDWYWGGGMLYYVDSVGSPARHARFAAIHRYSYYIVQHKGWSSTGVSLDTSNTGNKIDGQGSAGQDARFVFWEYLPGTWGANGSPWAEGGHMFRYEATNENASGQDVLTNESWQNLGDNRWGLDISSITTVPGKAAYAVLFVNGEAWDAASGRKRSTAAEVTEPKTWHSSGTYLTLYSETDPTNERLILGAWGVYFNADANITVKNFSALPGKNVIEPVWETANGGDYTQRFIWAGASDGSPAQVNVDALLAVHEYHEVYNWQGGSLELRSMNNIPANYPNGATYDRPATGNRGSNLVLAGKLIARSKSYDNVFDTIDFTTRNANPRRVVEVVGTDVELTLTNVTAPEGSWATVEDLATSEVYINGARVTESPYFLSTGTQRTFPFVQHGSAYRMLFEEEPPSSAYIFHSKLDQSTTDTTGTWNVSSAVASWEAHVAPLTSLVASLRGNIWKWGGFDPTPYMEGLTLDMLVKIDEVPAAVPHTSAENWRWLQMVHFKDQETVSVAYHRGYRNLQLSARLGAETRSKSINMDLLSLADQKFHRLTLTFNPYVDRIARVYVDGVLTLETEALPGSAVWGSTQSPERQAFSFGGHWAGGAITDIHIDEPALLHGVYTPTPPNSETTLAQAACERTQSGQPVFAGFGVPWNPFTQARELLLTVQCGEQARLNLGGDAQPYLTYIHESGYVWRDGAWQQIGMTGANRTGTWYVGSAYSVLPFSYEEFANTQYAVGYVCQLVSAVWKCGCRDVTCQEPAWQLQSFRR